MSSEADVVVVGAGPGGAASALALAQRGVKNVVLLDREGFPRDKTCGSGLSPTALEVLEKLGLKDEVVSRAYPVQSVRVVTRGGKEMVLAADAKAVVMLRREFDHLMVRKAVELGVELRTPFRAVELLKDDSGRAVGVREYGGATVRAKYVLCADGAQSIFSTDPRPKRSIATLMGWWEDFDFAPGQIDMVFDPTLKPLYGWLFPESDRRVNIGICVDGQDEDGNKSKLDLRAVFDAFLERHYAEPLKKARQVGKLKGHPIVYTNWVSHCTSPGALYLGEAARVTHNATGEGISQAMQSGVFAAEAVASILRGERSEKQAFSRYLWQHRRRFTAGFLAGHVLRAAVDSPLLDAVADTYNHPTVRRWVVKVLGSALAGTQVSEGERRPAAEKSRDAAA